MTKGFHPVFTITNRVTTGLPRIERAKGFLEPETLSECLGEGKPDPVCLILESHRKRCTLRALRDAEDLGMGNAE